MGATSTMSDWPSRRCSTITSDVTSATTSTASGRISSTTNPAWCCAGGPAAAVPAHVRLWRVSASDVTNTVGCVSHGGRRRPDAAHGGAGVCRRHGDRDPRWSDVCRCRPGDRHRLRHRAGRGHDGGSRRDPRHLPSGLTLPMSQIATARHPGPRSGRGRSSSRAGRAPARRGNGPRLLQPGSRDSSMAASRSRSTSVRSASFVGGVAQLLGGLQDALQHRHADPLAVTRQGPRDGGHGHPGPRRDIGPWLYRCGPGPLSQAAPYMQPITPHPSSVAFRRPCQVTSADRCLSVPHARTCPSRK